MAINLGGGMDMVARDRQQALTNMAANPQLPWGGQGGTGLSNKDLLTRRATMDGSFGNARALLQPMAAGQNGPFNQKVLQGLNAGASDNAAGQMRAARAVIDRSFGRQGLAGSGGAMRAKLDAQRQIGKGLRQEQTAIGTRAALGNADYQRSAIRDLMGLLGMEVGYNAQLKGPIQSSGELERLLGAGQEQAFPGGVGGFGGGGGGAGLGAPQDNWFTQWMRDQQASEDAAAQIRARNAALNSGQRATPGVNAPGGIGYGTVFAPPGGAPGPVDNDPWSSVFGGSYGFAQQPLTGPAPGPYAGNYVYPEGTSNPFTSGLLGLASGGAKVGGLGADDRAEALRVDRLATAREDSLAVLKRAMDAQRRVSTSAYGGGKSGSGGSGLTW